MAGVGEAFVLELFVSFGRWWTDRGTGRAGVARGSRLVAGLAGAVVGLALIGSPAAAGADCVPLLQSCPTTGPPAVTAEAGSTDSSEQSAVLQGTVDPNGLATSYHFAYGQGQYDQVTATAQVAAGYGAQPVSMTITALAPDTGYQFELSATNADGTTSEPGSFMTGVQTKPPLSVARPRLSRRQIRMGQSVHLSTSVSAGLGTW
jgi:hypothetical protein